MMKQVVASKCRQYMLLREETREQYIYKYQSTVDNLGVIKNKKLSIST